MNGRKWECFLQNVNVVYTIQTYDETIVFTVGFSKVREEE